jgi:hypothetical protein
MYQNLIYRERFFNGIRPGNATFMYICINFNKDIKNPQADALKILFEAANKVSHLPKFKKK